MLLVSIEGKLIDNIVIYKNELYFSYEDSATKEAVYTPVPTNEYIFNTDSFNAVQVFLYHMDYLGFCYTGNITNFKNECLKQFNEGITYFKYHGLTVSLESVEDFEINIVECWIRCCLC